MNAADAAQRLRDLGVRIRPTTKPKALNDAQASVLRRTIGEALRGGGHSNG